MKYLTPLAALLAPVLGHAHEGHGLAGAHWHATDTFGLVAGVVAVAVGVWWSGKDR